MRYRILIWLCLFLCGVFITLIAVSDKVLGGPGECLHSPECNMVATLGAGITSFPFGLAWLLLLNVTGNFFEGFATEASAGGFIMVLVGYAVLGYIQWFVIFPKIYNHLKSIISKRRINGV